jgi:hypothetical protein
MTFSPSFILAIFARLLLAHRRELAYNARR